MLKAIRHWWNQRQPSEEEDRAIFSRLVPSLPLLHGFDDHLRQRLFHRAREFLAAKTFEPAGGLTLKREQEMLVAIQAALPILELGIRWYRGWYAVILYPAEFVAPHSFADPSGVVHEGKRVLAGEAWDRGPMVLSWDDSAGGAYGEYRGNVVIHECAHKLDLLNGDPNGHPPLHPNMRLDDWSTAWSRAYADHSSRVAAGIDTWLDPYGAENAAEFFAVTSEAFFTEPRRLQGWYPRVYDQLKKFYRQDPLLRLG